MEDKQREFGEQPITGIMKRHGLKPHDLVVASEVRMTHKMVARACKGRWLTPNSRTIIINALSRAANETYQQSDLFNY